MRQELLFVPARNAAGLYRDIPEGRRIARRLKAKGRVCKADGCPTILSTYNTRKLCWVHEPHLGYRVA